jgi:hypothetical protein
MNTPRKFWFVLVGAVLALSVLACSFGAAATPTATPTVPQPTIPPPPTVPVNPMPDMVGYWLDTDTHDVHVIEWQGGQFVVTAVNDDVNGQYPVTSQSWNGSQLTWTYYVTDTGVSVTFTTITANGNNLYTTWSNDQGNSGDWTLIRTDSPYPQASSNQEAIPGMAGKWLDTDTQVVHTIEWQNGQYVVTSAIDPDEGSYAITNQSWFNNTLTWTYYRPATDVSVTFETVSVAGDVLNTNWTNSNGDSGTWGLERVP